ncbi:MAG: SagB/ThcOx family dehydrogenase [Thermogladius sp.]
MEMSGKGAIGLPEPDKETCLSKLISARRSVRRFRDKPLDLRTVSQLLWVSYGYVTSRRRVVPSAGALYPMEVYLAVKTNGVEGLDPGVYLYEPESHRLRLVRSGDPAGDLYEACLRQTSVREAPINIVIVGVPERIVAWYGDRGYQYMVLEAGHIGQNIYLAATEMGLGTVAIGAFDDDHVRRVLGLRENYVPLYIFPVGYPR